jgi:hypothetical protein
MGRLCMESIDRLRHLQTEDADILLTSGVGETVCGYCLTESSSSGQRFPTRKCQPCNPSRLDDAQQGSSRTPTRPRSGRSRDLAHSLPYSLRLASKPGRGRITHRKPLLQPSSPGSAVSRMLKVAALASCVGAGAGSGTHGASAIPASRVARGHPPLSRSRTEAGLCGRGRCRRTSPGTAARPGARALRRPSSRPAHSGLRPHC